MLSALISIFYLPISYCSLELQKIIVRFSHENGSVGNVECGVRSTECGKRGVWKMRGVENV